MTDVALVLAGGGARGAYEVGALSVLLPELEHRGQRPRILVGTSAGALNAAFLAAHADVATADLVHRALAIWANVRWGEVARSPISGASVRRAWGYAGEVLGVPGERLESLLDPEPLRTTLRGWIDFPRIEANVGAGHLAVASVVATSAFSGRSVVFHCGGAQPGPDHRRGIEYVATPLTEDHVLASAAIPAIFPAVRVQSPATVAGWYFDGGTRLNTPIRPALDFKAERVVVVALSAVTRGPAAPPAAQDQPDALVGIGQVLNGLFADQLLSDLQTLATVNRLLGSAAAVDPAATDPTAVPDPAATDPAAGGPDPSSPDGSGRRIPYILVAPQDQDAIARRALDVVREHYAGAEKLISHPDIAVLTRLVAGTADLGHANLLSFLLFAPEFTQALIALGQEDARRWCDSPHDLDDLWQVGPLPAP